MLSVKKGTNLRTATLGLVFFIERRKKMGIERLDLESHKLDWQKKTDEEEIEEKTDVGKIATINFVKKINQQEGKLEHFKCKKCKNRGFFYVVSIQETETQRLWETNLWYCDCMKIRNEIESAKRTGMGENLKWRLKMFKPKDEFLKSIKEKTKKYCMEESDTKKWIAYFGQPGSGKTLLASVVANHFLYNLKKQVKYIIWQDFINHFKLDISGNDESKEKGAKDLDMLKKCEVLFMDEVLKYFNQNDLKYLNEILNYRYVNNLKTIITSEKTLEEMMKLDQATTSRIIEMCGGINKYVIQIPIKEKYNWRIYGDIE